MALQRMDHTGVVVDDLAAAIAFFTEIGMAPAGRGTVDGPEVGAIVGLPGAASKFAMLEAPGGSRIELIAFLRPRPEDDQDDGAPPPPANVPGLRHLCFAVDDLHATLDRLRAAHGAELVGEVVDFGGSFTLCYVRGPSGIIVELAERLG